MRDINAARGEFVKLAQQRCWVHHHPWPNDRRDVAVEDTARDKMEFEGVFADDDRVPGVVATLVAHDHRNLLGEEVGRLPLPLVAPLQADDHAGRHLNPFRWR